MLNDLTEIGGPPDVCYAREGDILVIRKLDGKFISVSHEDITDSTFGVTADEIELLKP